MSRKITKATVDAVKPQDRDTFVWDSQVKGFGLKVTPKGRKVYVFQGRLHGRLRRFTIGMHGSPWTTDLARREAIRMQAMISSGEDPAEAKNAARSDVSVAELCALYLKEGCEGKKASTMYQDQNRIRRHILPLIGKRRVRTLKRADFERFMADVASGKSVQHQDKVAPDSKVRGGQGIASRTMGLLGAIMQFAAHRGIREDNPARGIKRYPDKRVDRYLSSDELRRLAQALRVAEERGENGYAIAAIRLLMLTGLRKSEALKLQWRWVDDERSCLHLPDSKTGSRPVPIGLAALQLLQSIERVHGNPHVFVGDGEGSHFVGLQKVWERIRAAADLADLRLHDLRHHFISVGASTGESLYVLGKIAGHSNSSTTQRYAHLADDPMKNAADSISQLVEASLIIPADAT